MVMIIMIVILTACYFPSSIVVSIVLPTTYVRDDSQKNTVFPWMMETLLFFFYQ